MRSQRSADAAARLLHRPRLVRRQLALRCGQLWGAPSASVRSVAGAALREATGLVAAPRLAAPSTASLPYSSCYVAAGLAAWMVGAVDTASMVAAAAVVAVAGMLVAVAAAGTWAATGLAHE